MSSLSSEKQGRECRGENKAKIRNEAVLSRIGDSDSVRQGQEIPPLWVKHSVKDTHRKGHFPGVLTFSFPYSWACLPPGVSRLI